MKKRNKYFYWNWNRKNWIKKKEKEIKINDFNIHRSWMNLSSRTIAVDDTWWFLNATKSNCIKNHINNSLLFDIIDLNLIAT